MSDKQTLILVPGLLNDEGLWRRQIDALSDRYDIRVADNTGHDTIKAIAADLLAGAPERFSLAGLSMGGYIALEVMRQAPGRVERLALIDTSARADTPEQTEFRKKMIDLAETGRFEEVMPKMSPLLLAPASRRDDDLVSEMYAMAERMGAKTYVRQQHAIMTRPDGRADLEAVTCPVLVMCGSEDTITPPEIHAEMAALMPNARLVVIPGAGHMTPMETPEAVTAVLQYWMQEG